MSSPPPLPTTPLLSSSSPPAPPPLQAAAGPVWCQLPRRLPGICISIPENVLDEACCRHGGHGKKMFKKVKGH